MEITKNLFFSTIEKNYLNRCTDAVHASSLWREVIEKYPPEKLQEFTRRPSLELTRQSGDLAVALLWVAQATLIHPMIKTAIAHEANPETLAFLETIDVYPVGALAIAEDKKTPFIVVKGNGNLILNGKKKYITGGAQSDFLLLTEKRPNTNKISGIIILPTKDIPGNSFQPIDMGCLSTSRHASLTFSNIHIPSENRLSIAPKTIRKTLKSWGIIEKSLILEAVTGLLLYLAGRIGAETGTPLSCMDEAESKLLRLSSEIDQQVELAVKGEFIPPIQFETGHIGKILNEITPSSENPADDELFYRFRDIQFFTGKLISKP